MEKVTKVRIENLRRTMADQAIDLICLGPGAHLEWLLGLHPHADERPLLFCTTQDKAGFLMPALEAESLRAHTDIPFFPWADDEGPQTALTDLLDDLDAHGARSIVLDETMRADFAALVQDHLMNAKRQFTESTVGALRMRKDDAAYNTLKMNAQIADRALQTAWAMMKPGLREEDVGAVIKDSFIAQGAKPLFGIVGAGPNGAFPHHQTGETLLKLGDAVVMDIGAAMGGYSSDITRMAVIGTPPEGYAEVHDVVERAVQAALAAAKPGVPAKMVDQAARDVISDAGYGEYFVHRTGHGLGTEVHEPPYITASSDTVLDEGMVFSIEPGIYLPGRFGIRLEEIVILRSDGPEILSDLPRDVVFIND
jgi:Xaa-Pro aminopeptidase